MYILSHRGIGTQAPENSLRAFNKTLQNGYGIEVDLRLTRDDAFVVAHDEIVQPSGSDSSKIRESTLEELQSITGESENRFPTLKDVLRGYVKYAEPGSKIALHLKDYHINGVEELLVDTLYDIMDEYPHLNLFENVFVFDILLDNAQTFASIEPRLDIALSIGNDECFPDSDHPTVYRYSDVRHEACWNTVWADEWRGGYYSPELFDTFRSDERTVFAVSPELHTSTVPQHLLHQTPEEIWPVLLSDDVAGICTDYPQKLKQFIQAEG